MHLSYLLILLQGYGEVMDDEDEDDEEGMDELMQNPEFLHSVLSSLPGVNPEEALQNLEQMKDQQQQKDNKKVGISEDHVHLAIMINIIEVQCSKSCDLLP